VIDNGSYECKAGWSNQSTPPLAFRNLATTNKTGRILVGPELNERSQTKSPFEKDLVQHFHAQEHIFDYVFSTLGFEEQPVTHPIVMTEALYNPPYCRERMIELLFEAYDIPSCNFGVDSLFSFGMSDLPADGIIVDIGHTTTHVIAVLDGLMRDCMRLNLGTYNCSDYLSRILQTRFFYNK
jgi:actin-related protein 5